MKSLSFLPAAALALLPACQDPTYGTAEKYPTYKTTSMGDTECEPLGVGNVGDPGRIDLLLITDSWADRVQDVLETEGITVKIFPENYTALNCYGSDVVTTDAPGVFRFNMPYPTSNEEEVWHATVAYPEEVYDTYEYGYTDSEGTRFENWELACFDENSDSRPDGNYGFAWVQNTYGDTEYIQVPGATEGWDCDLRLRMP